MTTKMGKNYFLYTKVSLKEVKEIIGRGEAIAIPGGSREESLLSEALNMRVSGGRMEWLSSFREGENRVYVEIKDGAVVGWWIVTQPTSRPAENLWQGEKEERPLDDLFGG